MDRYTHAGYNASMLDKAQVGRIKHMSATTRTRNQIGHRVRVVLVARRMTVTALAKAIGVPYRTLQSYLSADSKFPALVVADIAKALDVSLDFLVLGSHSSMDKEAIKGALTEIWALHPANFLLDGLDLERIAKVFVSTYGYHFVERRNLNYYGPDEPGVVTLSMPSGSPASDDGSQEKPK